MEIECRHGNHVSGNFSHGRWSLSISKEYKTFSTLEPMETETMSLLIMNLSVNTGSTWMKQNHAVNVENNFFVPLYRFLLTRTCIVCIEHHFFNN